MNKLRNEAMVVCLVMIMAGTCSGHGYLKEPPSRSSMWRYGFNTPTNYDDNQLFCGGFDVQWNKNGGKCGICGDRWDGPRDNEAGGKYATGIISRHYKEGQAIHVEVKLTMQHGGYFEFRICPNNDPNNKATQQCLDRYILRQPDGSTRYCPKGGSKTYNVQLMLPPGLTCTQCVFQWIWNTASNWGCEGGQCGKGLGHQEQFRGCSDVSISSSGSSQHTNSGNVYSLQNGPIATNVHSGNLNTFILPSYNYGQANHQSSLIHVLGGFSNILGTDGELCKATEQYRAQYPFADQFCINQCKAGRCLSTYFCTSACKKLSPVVNNIQPIAVCEATSQFKTMYPNADQYCRNICNLGQCPTQYCTDACRNA